MQLSWNSLGLHHKPSNKNILHNLNGSVASGQFLTIMGQSGAGKSSFLSILTARISKSNKQFAFQGQILMNNQQYATYVRQDDILMGTLTVQETFQFQAALRLHKITINQRSRIISNILNKLNLQECINILVGSKMSKSISGGQRKRVAIGLQLLANPQCLILDEPTSGLDSYNAYKIMKILKNLSQEGKIVIATLHQPSSKMFLEMDSLLLLGNGQTLYFGKADYIIKYMKNIDIKVDHRMNPADFYMLQVSQFKKNSGYKTPMTPLRWEQYSNREKSIHQQNKHIKNQKQMNEIQPFQSSPINIQFKSLTVRNFKNFIRTPSNISGKLVGLVLVPLYMATLYHGIGGRIPELIEQQQFKKYLTEFAAFVFMLSFFNFALTTFDTVITFAQEKQIALKQDSARLYSLACYFIAKIIVQIPISILISIFGTIIIYFVCQLQNDFYVFIQFSFILVLINLTGFFFGTLIGIIFNTQAEAAQIMPLIMIPVVIFGGLVVNLNQIPQYIRWLQYASSIRHGYSCLMINQLDTQNMHYAYNYEQIRDFVGINGQFKSNMLYLCVQFIVLIFLSIAGLYIKRKAM